MNPVDSSRRCGEAARSLFVSPLRGVPFGSRHEQAIRAAVAGGRLLGGRRFRRTGPAGGSPDDAAAHPSHRLLGGVSDLAGAEDLLALRLHHTQDVQEVQDLLKSLHDNDEYRRMLKDKFKTSTTTKSRA